MSRKNATSNFPQSATGTGPPPLRGRATAAGGELHQSAGGKHPALTTNQGTRTFR